MMKRLTMAIFVVFGTTTFAYSQNYGGSSTVIPLFQDDTEEDWEDEDKGWSFGLNIGAYFANKKSAVFYDGSGLYDLGDNQTSKLSIPERLSVFPEGKLTSNKYNEILTHYNATGYEFPSGFNDAYYPQNMRYQPAFLYGLQVKYNFNITNSLVMNMNVANLKTVDVYTIRFIGTTQQQNAQTDVRTLDINGTEDRFQLTLGYRTGIEMGPSSNWYFGIGGSMLGSKVKSNQVFIAEQSFDLMIGIDNPNQQAIQYQPRTELGFGGYLSTGIEMYFSEKYELAFGLMASRDKVKLGTYEDDLFNYSVFLTFSI